MSKKPDAHNDHDEIPLRPPPFAKPAPQKRTPKKAPSGEERGHRDPEMYARLSRPWPSREAATAAVDLFFKASHALRVKHGIADVTILAAVEANDAGQRRGFMMSHHSGDQRNQLAMVASAFRSLREQHDEAVRVMAGLAAPDVVLLTSDGAKRIERITAAMVDRLGPGSSWTASDTITAIMSNDALRAESHGALLDLVLNETRSPAEEMGALRGALSEILSVTGSRVARIAQRIREIEAEHPELKVEPAAEDGAPPAAPTEPAKADDLHYCRKMLADVREARREDDDTDRLSRLAIVERDWQLAIRLHHGDAAAREEVKARVDLLSRFLIWRGGTAFLNRCRKAVREERWGHLMLHVAQLEDDLVRDKTLRWTYDPEKQAVVAEPTNATAGRDGSIPTHIDPGGIGL